MKHIWKYLPIYSVPILGYIAFTSSGWHTWLVIMEAFFLIPVLELVIPPNGENYSKETELKLLQSRIFDILVYSMVPIVGFLLYTFLTTFQTGNFTTFEIIGRVGSMGIIFAALGINVAHELGHRHKKLEILMSKTLLLFSQYMHFYIEHNKGHHLYVSTKKDPATSRLNENLYAFLIRSITMSYRSAWLLESKRLAKEKISLWSLKNQMIQFTFLQLLITGCIYTFFGAQITLYYLLTAGLGIILLESVNYIEHYGLLRVTNEKGIVQKVKPIHSWNSDHLLGRMILFELSRHSDHHYMPSRKYQVLRHFEESPQMPTGYPGMLIISLFPFLWFPLMNKKIEELKLQGDNHKYLA